jgi:glycogen(starch) synthase
MIRKRILLASLLKPVSDTRMYEKIAHSLAQIPEADVHVAGFAGSASLPPDSRITVHPIFQFQRLSLERFTSQKKYWKLLNQLKPDLLIIGTHELLFLSWLYCRRSACRLVYDVQENYFLNLSTQQVYPRIIGKALGITIRGMEQVFSSGIDHFFLAEESYAQELPFIGQRYTVLQNKYLPPSPEKTHIRTTPVSLRNVRPLRLLYSGTISRLYGVKEAVLFTRQLRAWVPDTELTIIGYSADAEFLKELQNEIKNDAFVILIGGDSLVPHNEILAQEQEQHIGLLPYRPHPSTFSCVPTKLFEYLGNGLVTVMEKNPLWDEMLQRTNGGGPFSFDQALTPDFVRELLDKTYYRHGIPAEVFWQDEAQKVQRVAKELLRLV